MRYRSIAAMVGLLIVSLFVGCDETVAPAAVGQPARAIATTATPVATETPLSSATPLRLTGTPEPPTVTPVPASPTPISAVWQARQVIDAFRGAGLEVEGVHPMTKQEYGAVPMRAAEALRFLTPSLCPDCGGRQFSCASQQDVDAMLSYYDRLGQASALFLSWVFVGDNSVVQLNGELPEARAGQYEAALAGMHH